MLKLGLAGRRSSNVVQRFRDDSAFSIASQGN